MRLFLVGRAITVVVGQKFDFTRAKDSRSQIKADALPVVFFICLENLSLFRRGTK